jgi:DNA-directed RNA polymerase subunit beta
LGRKLAARVLKTWIEDFVDEDTGEVVSIERNEVILDRDTFLKKSTSRRYVDAECKPFFCTKKMCRSSEYAIIYNTFKKTRPIRRKKRLSTSIVSCVMLNHQMRKLHAALSTKLFFSEQRYNLGEVGRYRLNKKLGLEY